MFTAATAAALVLAVAAPQTETIAVTILKGDLAGAETMLGAQPQIVASDPEVLLNLAAIYASTNRKDAAATLYERVLADDAVVLDLADGSTLSSHDIARRGLGRVRTTLTAR